MQTDDLLLPTPPRTYRCRVFLIREDDGDGYSAIAADLPGCGSCGDTPDEAMANVAEAFDGVLGVYLHDTGAVPWLPLEQRPARPPFAEERVLTVTVTPWAREGGQPS